MIPSLRRITQATDAPEDLRVLAAALRLVDPGEAETLLRRVYEQVTTSGDHELVGLAASDLVTLLCDHGRLREALTRADQHIEHTRHAGCGSWSQLGAQAGWLQILSALGDHEEVLTTLPALLARMADLPDQRAGNDTVNPWNIRERILNTAYISAMALGQWSQALDLNNEVTASMRRHGASLP
jgi:hypothetical protein